MDEDAGRESPLRAPALGEARRRAVLDGLMTTDEHRAMELTAELFGILERASRGGDRDVHDADVAEVAGLVHGLQNLILAQAAARAFPDRYRLLGRRLERDAEARMGAIRLERVRHAEADAERRERPNGDYWTRDRGVPEVTELAPEQELLLPRYWTDGVFRWRDVLVCPAGLGDYGVLAYGACPAAGPHEAHRWAISGAERPDEVPAHAWRLCDPKPGLTGDSRGDLERIAAWSRRHPERRPVREAATELSCVYPGCTDRRDPRWHGHGAPADDPVCLRCGSDTCPGRHHTLACTAEVGGMTAGVEAAALLRRAYATPETPVPLDERLRHALATECATELDDDDIANVVAAVLPVARGEGEPRPRATPFRRDPEARR